jgi:hypothetical protein
MIITAGVMATAGAAVPLTAGASGALVALGYAGAAATVCNASTVSTVCMTWWRMAAKMWPGWIRKAGITPPLPRSILSRWQALAAY